MNELIKIDNALLSRCRTAAGCIADKVVDSIKDKTTTSVERSVARLMGIDGVDGQGVPLPNVLVDQITKCGKLEDGVFYWIGNAMIETGKTPREIALAIGNGDFLITDFPEYTMEEISEAAESVVRDNITLLDESAEERKERQTQYPKGPSPLLYVIVATGNIYEDTVQARAAAKQGADIIAVIRSTAQSLLDYVPFGPTTEGFGGTYATQENFRIMREALDEATEETGRYIQLVNYASGLCMPEIAVMGAIERLDMMLNDAMYGILFRDINMNRTFIDQYFSRMINAYSGITINTGEDNYLTTADAVEEGHTVVASQFINEVLALRSGMPRKLIGLGHAFEINPDREDGFLMEIAQAQLVRQLFPESPVKYMPPTKYMTGNIFKGHLMDGMFNLASVMTGQSIQLLGMMTEAVHTPFIQDRALSIENARYVFNNARHLQDEIVFRPSGMIQRRADDVLKETTAMLEAIAEQGLMKAIEDGMFAAISRPVDGGKGADGVLTKGQHYRNPFMDIFKEKLGIS
ncbi:MAG: lysine 5,6-aminomutase subunit alpha [Spirochaetales bacterium]|nr:lysine 5,6-aminomutase subunit alpha [Spirochaetales bacterium]